MQEQRFLGRSLWLLRRNAVEDGLCIDRCIMFDCSSALSMPIKQLSCRGRSSLHLINGGSNEVALANGIEQAEKLGRISRADYSGVFPRVTVQDLATDLLSSNQGRY